MNAIDVITEQLEIVHLITQEVVAKEIPDAAWRAKAHDGANSIAFIAWHAIATRDWTVHTWLQHASDIRTRASLASTTAAQPHPPFGMSPEAAGDIGRAVTRDDVLAYDVATQAALRAYLATLTEADLERVQPSSAHAFTDPDYNAGPHYREEAESMLAYPVWRCLTSPINGHIREHVGEMMAVVEMVGRRG